MRAMHADDPNIHGEGVAMRKINIDGKTLDVVLSCKECEKNPLVLCFRNRSFYDNTKDNSPNQSYVSFAVLYGDIECLRAPENYPGKRIKDCGIGRITNKIVLKSNEIFVSSSHTINALDRPTDEEVNNIYAELEKNIDTLIEEIIGPWKKR